MTTAQKTDIIFHTSTGTFNNNALAVFRYQAAHNAVYNKFLHYLDIVPEQINSVQAIPFIPVELFRSHAIITQGGNENRPPEIVFESSGTTGEITSKHSVTDLEIYKESLYNCFRLFYGDVKNYCILALLPSYLERKNASLVFMCNALMQASGNNLNGFYLNEYEKIKQTIIYNETHHINTLLIGVSYALLDLADNFTYPLKNTIIMETGGMKGRRKEITREELHATLKSNFHLKEIHSEYGMTELLSQAYSSKNGIFRAPPWMKILIRSVNDPFEYIGEKKTGCINIIDLANINSCSFIATQDLGKLLGNNTFEVLGRYDNSDIRGCNLMAG